MPTNITSMASNMTSNINSNITSHIGTHMGSNMTANMASNLNSTSLTGVSSQMTIDPNTEPVHQHVTQVSLQPVTSYIHQIESVEPKSSGGSAVGGDQTQPRQGGDISDNL